MLQDLRDRLTGPLVWFIVGLITIPFAFFGLEQFRSGGGDPVLAKVGDEKIRESRFRAGYEQRLQVLRIRMGSQFREDLIDRKGFSELVLNDMVQESLMRQHVRDAGYRASDAMVFDQIQNLPAFQEEGRFSSERYRRLLAQQGFAPTVYEEQLRSEIAADQMRAGLLEAAFVPPAAAALGFRLDRQQRWLAYAVFEAARYLPQVQASDEQVQERYEKQAARFQAPERLRVAYVELALAQLPPAPAPEADALKAVYEAQKTARFTTVEERRARHILINFGTDKDQARERIEKIAAQVAQGGDFAALATTHSDDSFSKAKGGDLGWGRRGQSLEKLEQVIFGLSAGEVSKPVETEYGWHLVKLEEVRPARTRPFEDADVQAELLASWREKDAERRYDEMAEKVGEVAFESPAALDPVAQAAGLPVQASGWFTRDEGEGVFADAAVRDAAFADEVLQAGENSRPITVGDKHIIVLRKLEHEPPRQRPLEEVAASIRDELKAEGARAKAAADASEALDALGQGRALEQVVTQKKAQLKAPGLVARNASDVDPRILAELFRLPRPTEGAASRATVKLPDGDVAVVVSTAVQDGDWATAPEADRAQQLARQRESLAGAEFVAYRADLEKRVKVEILQQPGSEPTPAE